MSLRSPAASADGKTTSATARSVATFASLSAGVCAAFASNPTSAGAAARAATDFSSVRRSMLQTLAVWSLGFRGIRGRVRRWGQRRRDFAADLHGDAATAGLSNRDLQLRSLGHFPHKSQAETAFAWTALPFVAAESPNGHQLRQL